MFNLLKHTPISCKIRKTDHIVVVSSFFSRAGIFILFMIYLCFNSYKVGFQVYLIIILTFFLEILLCCTTNPQTITCVHDLTLCEI